MRSPLLVLAAAAPLLIAAPAHAQLWEDATDATIGTTAEWSNKVELGDIDGDGWVDILFANGGGYSEAGTPEPQRVFRNLGNWDAAPPHFEEVTDDVFGAAATRLSRVIKVRDLDGDGDQDIFVGGAHGTASGLFRQGAPGVYSDVTAASLPAGNLSLGDAELGDVDGDGDLDLVLADWGALPVFPGGAGGQTRLWLNDGAGVFSDATAARMPVERVGMSWDLELVDVDDDADLDVLVSCKACTGGRLYINDGAGTFSNASNKLPQRANNYEYEPMDLDGDGDLDLVTINDGPQFKETVLVNDGAGNYSDDSSVRLPGAANVSFADDNVDTFLDVDQDGDADFVIGALGPDADRLLRNDGAGRFTLDDTVMTLDTPGTLGLAFADLNHDGRLDVVQAQGEAADPDKVLLATAALAVDTGAPRITIIRRARSNDLSLVVRIHDHKSPSLAHDWQRIAVEPIGAGTTAAIEMTWRGEYLWAATLDGAAFQTYRVCATDIAGNQQCSPELEVLEPSDPDAGVDPDPDAGDPGPDAGDPAIDGAGGGCCQGSPGGAGGGLLLGLLVLLARFRTGRATSRDPDRRGRPSC